MAQRGSLRREGKQWVLRFREGATRRALRVGAVSELRTRAAARAKADVLMQLSGHGPLLSGESIRFEAYVERWRAGHMDGIVRPSTAASWVCTLKKHLLPCFGDQFLTAIDVQAVQQFVAQLGRSGCGTARNQNITSLLRQILRQAARDGYASHPIGPFTLKFPKDGRRGMERRWFTPEESRRIIQGAHYPHRAMYALMAYTGMRCGEALGLAWEHIDEGASRISVRQAATDGQVWLPKTRESIADLPLPVPLAQELAGYRRWLTDEGRSAQGLLFPSPRGGGPLHACGVRINHFQPLLARLGIPPGGLHGFRHGLTTLMLSAGESPHQVQHTLRHSNLRTTMSYAHTNSQRVGAALDRAAAAISGAVP